MDNGENAQFQNSPFLIFSLKAYFLMAVITTLPTHSSSIKDVNENNVLQHPRHKGELLTGLGDKKRGAVVTSCAF